MNNVEALKAARALIEDPENWTTGEPARDANGDAVDEISSFAVCWCALGALKAGWNDPSLRLLNKAAIDLGGNRGGGLPPAAAVNDGHSHLSDGSTGHPAVLKIYDKAIELAEKEAGQ